MRVWFADSVRLVLMMALLGSLLGALALSVAAQDEESLVNRLSSLEQLHNRIAIPQQSEFKQPATTVKEWIAQIEASLVQITGVRVEATETGVEIVLDTAGDSLEVPTTRVVGNALIADIPNAVLAQGDFSQANPIAEIALVSVTSLPNNQVQVTITGTDAPPVVEVITEAQGLVLAATPDDALEIIVTGEQEEGYKPSSASTATRTYTPLRDIPQSIQVVPRQVLEDRNVRTVNEAVETVAGVVDGGTFVGAPSAGSRIIRGFDTSQDGGASIFRNGYRDSTYSDLVGITTGLTQES